MEHVQLSLTTVTKCKLVKSKHFFNKVNAENLENRVHKDHRDNLDLQVQMDNQAREVTVVNPDKMDKQAALAIPANGESQDNPDLQVVIWRYIPTLFT